MENKWWGYLHVNKSIQVKRFFDPTDLDDAYESPFVEQIFQPFKADSREEAIKIIEGRLYGKK